jgi:hypothetical protein
MIAKYHRAARTAAELHLGEMAPLVDAIPELSALAPRGPEAPGARKVSAKVSTRAPTPRRGRSETPRNYVVGHEGLEPSANGLREDAAPARDGSKRSLSERNEGSASTGESASGGSVDSAIDTSGDQPSPRRVLLAALAEGFRACVLAGDIGAARIAQGAIDRLLGTGDTGAPSATVVDLQITRARKDRVL